MNYRAGTLADADGLARLVIEGFEEYHSFAPDGWSPPPLADEVGWLRRAAARPRRLVHARPSPTASSPGRSRSCRRPATGAPSTTPALAHLRNLFVRREHWGTGVATTLLAAAIAAARERGYEQMRLFTPAQQRRARRFYEREGWAVAGEEYHDPGPDLVIVEYRRALREP